jgi:hypothetical protein
MNKHTFYYKSQIPSSKFQIPRGTLLGAWSLGLGTWGFKSKTLVSAIIGSLVLLSCSLLYAQNPGYQGKRFSLNYNFYTFNALENPNENGESGLLSFNTTHYANLDMAVFRKMTVGASFEYINTGFKFKENYNIPIPDPYDPYNSSYYDEVHSESVGKMEAYEVGLYLRKFFGGNIAPLGSYFKPEISLIFYKVYPGNPIPTYKPPGYGDPVFNNQSPYKTVAISLELGQNRVLFNRLFIDYGLRLKLIPAALKQAESGHNSNTTYLQIIPRYRLAMLELFNIKLGIGVLLF